MVQTDFGGRTQNQSLKKIVFLISFAVRHHHICWPGNFKNVVFDWQSYNSLLCLEDEVLALRRNGDGRESQHFDRRCFFHLFSRSQPERTLKILVLLKYKRHTRRSYCMTRTQAPYRTKPWQHFSSVFYYNGTSWKSARVHCDLLSASWANADG